MQKARECFAGFLIYNSHSLILQHSPKLVPKFGSVFVTMCRDRVSGCHVQYFVFGS